MKATGKGKRSLSHWLEVSLLLVLYDLIVVNAAYFLALWLRFDFQLSAIVYGVYFEAWLRFLPFYSVVSILVFFCFKLYHSLWQFASITELVRVSAATFVTAVIHAAGITLLFQRMPLSYYFIGALLPFYPFAS